jgi:hypothetical protein
MKKFAIMLLVGVALVSLLALCSCSEDNGTPTTTAPPQDTTHTTPAVTTAAPAPEHPAPQPAEGVLSYQKEGESITAYVTLPKCAGEAVSLLLLTDLRYQYSWAEAPDACLSDLGQLTLSSSGEGSLTLTPKTTDAPLYLILSTSCGSYAMEVSVK